MLTFDRNTQRTRLLLSILIHFRPTSSSKNKRWKILSIFIYLYPNECSDSVCVKNIEDANKKYLHLLVITEFDAIGEYKYSEHLYSEHSCNSERLPFVFTFQCWISII